jgi:hypothetical protein
MKQKTLQLMLPASIRHLFKESLNQIIYATGDIYGIDLCITNYPVNRVLSPRNEFDMLIFFHGSFHQISRVPYRYEELCQFHHGVFAHRDYIAEKGMPEAVADLEKHDIIVSMQENYGYLSEYDWTDFFECPETLGIIQLCPKRTQKLDMILNGEGIGATLSFILSANDDIVQIMPDLCRTRDWPLYFGINKKTQPHLREVAEFVKTRVKDLLVKNMQV